MPYGPRLSEHELRSVARQLIIDGQLPILFAKRLVASYGAGSPCCLCRQPIEKHHVEYQVTDAHDGGRLSFHLFCHAAWQLECIAIRSTQEAGRPERLA